VDSDFDWGQDLKRLPATLARHDVHRFSFAYNGSADLTRAGLPPLSDLARGRVTTGWIAISENRLRDHPKEFGWIEQYQPVDRAGKSIRVYCIPGRGAEDSTCPKSAP
jgi:hypothetical protein